MKNLQTYLTTAKAATPEIAGSISDFDRFPHKAIISVHEHECLSWPDMYVLTKQKYIGICMFIHCLIH